MDGVSEFSPPFKNRMALIPRLVDPTWLIYYLYFRHKMLVGKSIFTSVVFRDEQSRHLFLILGRKR